MLRTTKYDYNYTNNKLKDLQLNELLGHVLVLLHTTSASLKTQGDRYQKHQMLNPNSAISPPNC